MSQLGYVTVPLAAVNDHELPEGVDHVHALIGAVQSCQDGCDPRDQVTIYADLAEKLNLGIA